MKIILLSIALCLGSLIRASQESEKTEFQHQVSRLAYKIALKDYSCFHRCYKETGYVSDPAVSCHIAIQEWILTPFKTHTFLFNLFKAATRTAVNITEGDYSVIGAFRDNAHTPIMYSATTHPLHIKFCGTIIIPSQDMAKIYTYLKEGPSF